jgi:hypothetical protein
LHEFGHVFDNHSGGKASDKLGERSTPDNKDGSWERSDEGFFCSTADCLEHRPSMGYLVDPEGDDSYVLNMDQASAQARDEQWADTYMSFMLNESGDPKHGFPATAAGNDRIFEFVYIIGSLP